MAQMRISPSDINGKSLDEVRHRLAATGGVRSVDPDGDALKISTTKRSPANMG